MSVQPIHPTPSVLALVLDRLDALDRHLDLIGQRANVTELWLDKHDMARSLGVSTRWLEERTREGLPHRDIGPPNRTHAGKYTYHPPTVVSWLRNRGYIKEIG